MNEEDIKCPICKSDNLDKTPLTGIFIDEVNCRCRNCGHVFNKIIEPKPVDT